MTEGAEIRRCKHCGRLISGKPNSWIHVDGRQRGLHRCDGRDSGLPYGYDAEPEGEPCTPACLGSAPGEEEARGG